MDFLEIWLYGFLRVNVKYNLGPCWVGCVWENLYATLQLILTWKDTDSNQWWASAG